MDEEDVVLQIYNFLEGEMEVIDSCITENLEKIAKRFSKAKYDYSIKNYFRINGGDTILTYFDKTYDKLYAKIEKTIAEYLCQTTESLREKLSNELYYKLRKQVEDDVFYDGIKQGQRLLIIGQTIKIG